MKRELFTEGPYETSPYPETHEENLLTYVVLDAIDNAKNNKDVRKADEDLYWLFDQPLNEYKSFGWYCDLLRWNLHEMRVFLKRIWHRTDFRDLQIARIAMSTYPSANPRRPDEVKK